MDAYSLVAKHYQWIVDRVNAGGVNSLSDNDRIIWYIVSAACEKDMEGFDSIFVQFVSEPELVSLIDSLRSVDEPELAMLFEAASEALHRAGFYDRDSPAYYQLGPDLVKKLGEIERNLGDRLWGLDEKLAKLIGGPSVNQGD